jgi:hypothetical protein
MPRIKEQTLKAELANGSFAPVYIARKLSDGRFVIAGGAGKMEISWQVTGIRSDNWARANPLYVEECKHECERGQYRHPDAHTLGDKDVDGRASQQPLQDRGAAIMDVIAAE